MANDTKLTDYEKAHIDYLAGKKYKEIAAKYGVKENTVKSWKRRYGWIRDDAQEKVGKGATGCELGNNLDMTIKLKAKLIEEDLMKQLSDQGITTEHHKDMIYRYIKFYYISKYLEEDIELRGVSIEWSNGGKQQGIKKNDSITELTKVSTEMRNILNDLGLKATPKVDDDDDI